MGPFACQATESIAGRVVVVTDNDHALGLALQPRAGPWFPHGTDHPKECIDHASWALALPALLRGATLPDAAPRSKKPAGSLAGVRRLLWQMA